MRIRPLRHWLAGQRCTAKGGRGREKPGHVDVQGGDRTAAWGISWAGVPLGREPPQAWELGLSRLSAPCVLRLCLGRPTGFCQSRAASELPPPLPLPPPLRLSLLSWLPSVFPSRCTMTMRKAGSRESRWVEQTSRSDDIPIGPAAPRFASRALTLLVSVARTDFRRTPGDAPLPWP